MPMAGKNRSGRGKIFARAGPKDSPPPLPLTNCSSSPLALSVPILSNLLFQMREIYGMHAFKAAITHNQNPTRHLGVERVKLNEPNIFSDAEKFYCN